MICPSCNKKTSMTFSLTLVATVVVRGKPKVNMPALKKAADDAIKKKLVDSDGDLEVVCSSCGVSSWWSDGKLQKNLPAVVLTQNTGSPHVRKSVRRR